VDEKAIRGIPWTLLTYALNKVISVATTIVLARLLVPADFGIVALATVVIQLVNAFGTLGLGGALVVRQDLDERGKGTILALMLGLGTLIALLIAALSPVIADLFDEPRLTGVLAALSTIVVLGGFTWFYETVMQRELEFRRRFVAITVQSVVSVGLAVSLAALGAGVWSLVIATIGGTVVYAAALLALVPYRVRPAFDRGAAREAIRTGRGFLLQGGLAFVQQNADYISVGRVLGAGQLGFYSMAYRIGELPYYAIADPVASVTFPSFARMRHEGEDVATPFLSALRMVALVACPVGIFLSAAAEPFTVVLFGDKWRAMIGPLSVLGIWAAVRPIQATIGWLLNSVGQAGIMGVISAVVLLPMLPALVVAAELGGITAVAWVMLADMILSLLVLGIVADRRAHVGVVSQWRAVSAVLAGSVVTWAAVSAVANGMSAAAPGVTLAACALTALGTYVAVVSVTGPGLLREALAQVGRALGRVSSPAANSR